MEKDLTMNESLAMRSGTVAAVGSTPRIQALNKLFHNNKPSVDLHKARCFTEVFQETEGESTQLRRGKAFGRMYSTFEPVIYPHERLVMWQGPRPRVAQVAIEIQASWIHDENLDELPTRSHDPYNITKEEIEELRNVHIPYWYNKTALYAFKKTTPTWERGTESGIVEIMNYFSPGSHFIPDYEVLFKIGLKGYEDKIRACMAKIDYNDPDEFGKEDFYQSLLYVIDGVKTFSENYAKKALEMAETEPDPQRVAELKDIARVCRNVPYHPPQDFYEAIQTVWVTNMMLNLEGTGVGMSMGRLDQVLYPFYRKDVDEGRLTPEGAMEFIEELYLKAMQQPFFSPAANAKWAAGYYRYENLTVGGIDVYGNDATNELSYLCLRAMRYIRAGGPSIALFVGPKTPDTLILEGVKLAAEGLGHPSFFNIDVTHRMLEYRASGPEGKSVYSFESIRQKGTNIGCVEPVVMGEQFGHKGACLLNFANTFLLALHDGVLPKGQANTMFMGKQFGPHTGDARNFRSIDEVEDAFFQQLEFAMKEGHRYLMKAERLQMDRYPFPVMSILGTGCIEKGIDIASGGAICNDGPNFTCEGLSNVADSMAAIKKLVFDDGKLTMDQILTACEANFEGYEEIRQMLSNCPKYGNDDDYVDVFAVKILEFFAKTARSLRNNRGAYCDAGIQPSQVNVTLGAITPATPDGRFDTTPLGDAMSSAPRADKSGPTAAINSYSKINHERMCNGTLINMWINRNELIAEE